MTTLKQQSAFDSTEYIIEGLFSYFNCVFNIYCRNSLSARSNLEVTKRDVTWYIFLGNRRYGFRSKSGTLLIYGWGKIISGLFLDLTKAFNCVNHEIFVRNQIKITKAI